MIGHATFQSLEQLVLHDVTRPSSRACVLGSDPLRVHAYWGLGHETKFTPGVWYNTTFVKSGLNLGGGWPVPPYKGELLPPNTPYVYTFTPYILETLFAPQATFSASLIL